MKFYEALSSFDDFGEEQALAFIEFVTLHSSSALEWRRWTSNKLETLQWRLFTFLCRCIESQTKFLVCQILIIAVPRVLEMEDWYFGGGV